MACDREGHKRADCKFDRKEDGSPLNDKATRDKKMAEIRAAWVEANKKRKESLKFNMNQVSASELSDSKS